MENEQIGDWKCICGVCLNEMPIAEWMPYSLFWKNYNLDKPLPHEDHPIPHLNRSHTCPHCNAHWELIENLGNLDWVVDRYRNAVYLVGSPCKNPRYVSQPNTKT